MKSALVIFKEEIPKDIDVNGYDEVISGEKLKSLIKPGNIYEGTELLEELSKLSFYDGTPIYKSILYKGYELWWMHGTDIFRYFCLPYTQYKELLEYLNKFERVALYNSPHQAFFSVYLEAYKKELVFLNSKETLRRSVLPFGVLIQMCITAISIPVLMVLRRPLLVYTGDKFEKNMDHDFRMRFVYKELRQKKIPFVEFIRGVEPWNKVLSNAWVRKRPAVYSEAIIFVSRFLSFFCPQGATIRRQQIKETLANEISLETRFELLVAIQYVFNDEDIWAIRIMKNILKIIGVKVAFIPASSERTFHTVIASKINNIPSIGIMHGVQTRYYNHYDFLRGFKGQKRLSVDKFGLWSEWWKNYYLKNSHTYLSDQLYISGPMRPLIKKKTEISAKNKSDKLRVLFVSEEMAVPEEALPYLHAIMADESIDLTLKFRPYRDGFEQWLLVNRPEILKGKMKIARASMQEAFMKVDIAVGCQSTGVMEAVLQDKIPIYFRTQKWGDYYNLKEYDEKHSFFAENPKELIEKIKKAKSVSLTTLKDLQEQYFGNPYKNGSQWVVEQIQQFLK